MGCGGNEGLHCNNIACSWVGFRLGSGGMGQCGGMLVVFRLGQKLGGIIVQLSLSSGPGLATLQCNIMSCSRVGVRLGAGGMGQFWWVLVMFKLRQGLGGATVQLGQFNWLMLTTLQCISMSCSRVGVQLAGMGNFGWV